MENLYFSFEKIWIIFGNYLYLQKFYDNILHLLLLPLTNLKKNHEHGKIIQAIQF